MKPNRLIGVRHRNKKTEEGEERPTALCIAHEGDPANTTEILLQTEQDEIDWAHGVLPIKWRKVESNEDVSEFLPRHLEWRKVKTGEDVSKVHQTHLRPSPKNPKITEQLVKVPAEYTGIEKGDTIVMLAGGSGNLFAHLLSRVGEHIDTKVMRTSAARAKKFREGKDYSSVEFIHVALIWMYTQEPEGFRRLRPRHRQQVEIEELYKLFAEIQNDRKSCGLRLYQRAKRAGYLDDNEISDHVEVTERYKKLLADDPVHNALLAEEKRVEREALKVMETMPMYTEVFEKIEGLGARIALRMIASIPDISAFETDSQFRAFCGVHALGTDNKKLGRGEVPPEARGGFPRKRRGVICDWKPVLRQALYLFADQMNRRRGSFWGAKRLEVKTNYRIKHPEPVEMENGAGKKVKRYTDGHIHNMSAWKTLNKFCRWLFHELKALDERLDEEERKRQKEVA